MKRGPQNGKDVSDNLNYRIGLGTARFICRELYSSIYNIYVKLACLALYVTHVSFCFDFMLQRFFLMSFDDFYDRNSVNIFKGLYTYRFLHSFLLCVGLHHLIYQAVNYMSW